MSSYNPEQIKLEDFELIIADLYKINAKKHLGSGTFGEIFSGQNLKTNKEVAIKLELMSNKHLQLLKEAKIYLSLQGGTGIPKMHYFGTQGKYNFLVMEKLGPSLEDWFNYCQHQFTMKTTLTLTDQIISRLEFFHHKGYVHKDVKPDNFLVGLGKNKNTIYLIDYGLSKSYLDNNKKEHIPFNKNRTITGTARYASINSHLGYEQSRRDDLESVAYMIVYFLRGFLPWMGTKAKSMKEKYDKVKDKKMNTKINALCVGLPNEIEQFFIYIKTLKFQQCPDYTYLKNLIRTIAIQNHFEYDSEYDWIIRKKIEDKKNDAQFYEEIQYY